MAHIEWLSGRLPREVAGGKGASLSELVAAGFTVPPGFVVTADAYRHFAEDSGMEARIDAVLRIADVAVPQGAREAAVQITALVAETPLPADLAAEIAAAYEELTARIGLACAVRSSAISEDGLASSYAGLYETYLNVVGAESVVDAVRKCYASLWSERAVRYRASRAASGPEEAMAVVVMGMVQSERSGIAFTAHPVTGSRDHVVINASWGLGEAIVSGRVTPDSFVVEKGSFAVIEREVAEKEFAILADPSGAGTVETELDFARASACCLDDSEIELVARMAAMVEEHHGGPQDIEWGMQNGTLYLLQSRPITTL